MVSALVVVNSAGAVVDTRTGALFGEYFDGRITYPDQAVHEQALRSLAEAARNNLAASGGTSSARLTTPPLNTTLAVVATDAGLSRAQAHKLAGTAHDGIARAVRPVHLLNDGDTVFALASGERPLPAHDRTVLNEILAAGADVVTQAIVRAVRAAESITGPGGVYLSYMDLYGS